MTISQARGVTTDTNDEESVARYLQAHVDFFERHLPLLARLRLPHVRAGSTISLVERQVEVLREQRAAADGKLADFMRVARANDTLAERIHRFTRRLLRARTREEVITQLEASLREDFEASHAVLLLVQPDAAGVVTGNERFLRSVAADDPGFRSFENLLTSGKPRCGQVRDSQRDYIFGAETADIGSVALIPLGSKGSLGLLAVGSNDHERFHPGMSTEFLARMGELIAEALAKP